MAEIGAEHCQGCRDDFYNGKNQLGIRKCWSRDDAFFVTRYEIHKWTPPTRPGAFVKRILPNCYHSDEYSYHSELPECAIDVRC
jgi:hypothetical protein